MDEEATDTPRTNETIANSNGQWSYELRDLCRQIERELVEAQNQIDANHKATLVIERMLYEAREERDKLADALRIIDQRVMERKDAESDLKFCGEVAFAALAATTKDPHKFCRTTYHCGCRYDS